MKKYRLIINPIDLLIAAGIVALISFASVFSAPRQANARDGDPLVRFTIELSEKEEGFHTRIQPGAPVFDSLKKYDLGTVVRAYGLPYQEDAPDETDNTFKRAPVAGREFTYIEVESYAQTSDYATSIGQYDIMVNKEVFVRSKQFAGKGYITAITVIGD